jgi:hypothetical protein
MRWLITTQPRSSPVTRGERTGVPLITHRVDHAHVALCIDAIRRRRAAESRVLLDGEWV